MSRRPETLAALVSSALLFSCAGSGGPLAAAKVFAQVDAARCAWARKCSAEFEYVGCTAMAFANEWPPNFDPGEEVASGRMAFDPAKAKACVDEVGLLPCPAFHDALSYGYPLDCAAMLVGRVDAGSACVNDVECASGACGGTPCSGRCLPLAKRGEPCQPATCAAGLVCGYAHTCLPVPTVGESCRGAPCASGLFCTEDGKCVKEPSEGEPCLAGRMCGRGLACSPSSICLAPAENGGPCVSGDMCRSGYCDEAPDGGVCAPAPTEGQACWEVPTLCAPGLFCNMAGDISGGICARKSAGGAACTFSAQDKAIAGDPCMDGFTCVIESTAGFTGVCRPWANEGGPCTPHVPGVPTGCMEGLQCGDDHLCHGPPMSGRCWTLPGPPCGKGAYCDDNGTCQPLKPFGAACHDVGSQCLSSACGPPTECASASCVAGKCAAKCALP